MDDFDKHRERFEDKAESEIPYQPRKYRMAELDIKGNRWVFPLILVLILLIGAGTVWFLGSRNLIAMPGWVKGFFTPAEETLQVALPEVLFAGQDLEEVTARAVEEQGVKEVAHGEDNTLIYTMTDEVRSSLLVEAESNLENKLAEINDQVEHPEVVSISSDGAYKDFYLVATQGQVNRALVTASKVFMLAVYYQYINTEDLVREVTVAVEDTESGDVIERLLYPGDLDRAAEIIEDPTVLVDEPTTPQPGDKVVVSTGPDNLNLRNGPEITYLIIDILSSGTVLEVMGSEGVWLEVITPDGSEGWVHGDFVEPYDEEN